MAMKLTCERFTSLLNEVSAEVLSYVPTEVGDHLTEAKKELLAATRSMIDERIRRSDERWDAAKAKRAERKSRDAGEEKAAQ